MAVLRHSDRDLAARSRKGDTGAFSALVERHQRLIFGVALAITGDRALAEDLGQETFVAAWRSLATLEDDAKIVAWLAGITRNLAHNALRAQARRRSDELAGDPVDPGPTPLDHVLAEESEVLLQRTLEELPELYREAMVLYYVEGRSVSHVAAGLGVSEDAVKQRLSRARQAMRDRLAERLEATLEGMRPRRSFVPAVGAAIGIKGAAKTTTGVIMATSKVIWGTTILAAAAAVTVVVVVSGRDHKGPAAKPTAVQAPSPAADPPAAPARPATATAGPRTTPARARLMANAGERSELQRAIAARRQQRVARPPSRLSGAGGSLTADSDEDADKTYVREAVHAILPLVSECYDEALTRQPALEGTVILDFTIEGEPDVGGLIGTSEVHTDGTTIADAEMLQCLRETMYAIEIDPPSSGGVVQVTYPFAFAPAPRDPR